MSIFDELSSAFSHASKNAKKTLEIKKISAKIKDCEYEEDLCLTEIGRLVYKSKKCNSFQDDKRLNELFDTIENIIFRKNQLSKQKDEIFLLEKKELKEQSKQLSEHNFTKLSKNENDIRIKRTDSGILLVRICPGCKVENPSNTDYCYKCEYKLR